MLAVGAAAIVTPICSPAATGAIGAGSAAFGLAGSTNSICNSVENYLKYKIPPNTGKNSNGITGYFHSIWWV